MNIDLNPVTEIQEQSFDKSVSSNGCKSTMHLHKSSCANIPVHS